MGKGRRLKRRGACSGVLFCLGLEGWFLSGAKKSRVFFLTGSFSTFSLLFVPAVWQGGPKEENKSQCLRDPLQSPGLVIIFSIIFWIQWVCASKTRGRSSTHGHIFFS